MCLAGKVVAKCLVYGCLSVHNIINEKEGGITKRVKMVGKTESQMVICTLPPPTPRPRPCPQHLVVKAHSG